MGRCGGFQRWPARPAASPGSGERSADGLQSRAAGAVRGRIRAGRAARRRGQPYELPAERVHPGKAHSRPIRRSSVRGRGWHGKDGDWHRVRPQAHQRFGASRLGNIAGAAAGQSMEAALGRGELARQGGLLSRTGQRPADFERRPARASSRQGHIPADHHRRSACVPQRRQYLVHGVGSTDGRVEEAAIAANRHAGQQFAVGLAQSVLPVRAGRPGVRRQAAANSEPAAILPRGGRVGRRTVF